MQTQHAKGTRDARAASGDAQQCRMYADSQHGKLQASLAETMLTT